MDEATWNTIMKYLPWVLLGVALLAQYDRIKDAFRRRVLGVSHQFASMGSKTIVRLLDAIGTGSRPEMISAIDAIYERYSGDRGALLFGYEVFDFWIDDALEDPEYRDKVGRRLEKEILGFVITEEQQNQFGRVASNLQNFGLKSSAAFFQGLATGKFAPVRQAIADVTSRLGDPDRVDDEIVALAPNIVKYIKERHPEHIASLKEALLTLEDAAKLSK